MCDEWMTPVTFPISREKFHQLPRHAAFDYEYVDELACLTPRARCYHAVLDLTRYQAVEPLPEQTSIRLVGEGEPNLADLEGLFAAAFDRQQPFGGLDMARRKEAARVVLRKTMMGGDGPWIRAASFVALTPQLPPVGAIFITLLPDLDAADWDSFHWREPPPEDCIARCLGRPHLTWIFVGPTQAGGGTGTALLAASVAALKGMGYQQLATTFMAGNDSSMLWHWRNGFQLQAHPGSRRRFLRLQTEIMEQAQP